MTSSASPLTGWPASATVARSSSIVSRSQQSTGPRETGLVYFAVLALSLEASLDGRSRRLDAWGDDEGDYGLPAWAGVLPLTLHASAPHPNGRLPPDVAEPAYLVNYDRRLRPAEE